jgi:nitrate reductase assembly molybdenum cofactor insertion protein NarJ
MTPVIWRKAGPRYGRRMSAPDDIQRVATALTRPRAGHVDRLERARQGMAAGSGEVARQLGIFLDRVADLTTDELRELYDETFRETAVSDVSSLASRLVHVRTSEADARVALDVLAPALDRLEANRNPFSHVVRALCCALLAKAQHVSRAPL